MIQLSLVDEKFQILSRSAKRCIRNRFHVELVRTTSHRSAAEFLIVKNGVENAADVNMYSETCRACSFSRNTDKARIIETRAPVLCSLQLLYSHCTAGLRYLDNRSIDPLNGVWNSLSSVRECTVHCCFRDVTSPHCSNASYAKQGRI